MMRLIISLALVYCGSTQYTVQRNNPTDNIPAWYQMSKPAAAPSYNTYERREQFERPQPQHTNTFTGYGSYPNRPVYPDTQMPGVGPMPTAQMGMQPSARRYPGGQDPNSELIAAIKDVVAKFKASLDETGLDQDVRLMGNQLKNTWQQLRTGVDRGMRAVKQSAEMSIRDMNYGPMNEQLGRLLDKAVADSVDPTEQKLRRD